ncbi:MAG: hypothetical protein ACYTBJ_02390 [Planctomycetota bacterium]|jgi:hypothetical protein
MTDFLQVQLGGSLSHTMKDLPSDGARWDATPAPSVVLKTKSGGSLRGSTDVTLGPTTTLASGAVAGTTLVGIGTTSALRRWEEYVIGPNPAGEWERCLLDAVGSSYVKTLDELEYTYSTGDTFRSTRMSTTVTAGTVGAVEINCFAEWRYAVDGQIRKESTRFHVSRYAPRLTVTALDAVQYDPAFRDQVGSNQRIDLLLRMVWENYIKPDITKVLGSPGAVISGEAVHEATLLRAEEYIYRQGRNTERADKYAELYASKLEEIVLGPVDLDQSGGQSKDEIPPGMRSRPMVRG